jgi:ribosomal protein L40E
MSIDDIYEENTDWCVKCGAEHGYMCGPCEKCGSTTFTKKRPKPKLEREQEVIESGNDRN